MRNFRKFIKGATAAVIAVSLLTVSAFAYTGTATVAVTTHLNVRASASSSAEILGKLSSGVKVTVTGSSGKWYKIKYNSSTGWVLADYITTTTTTSAAARIKTVVSAAKSELGVKYTYGGVSPATGFDCSGLVLYCFAKGDVTLPHSSVSQSTKGQSVARANLKAGDVIFFCTNDTGTVNHCGIYIGDNNFINAQSGAGKVKTASLGTSYWSNAYLSARRYIY